MVTVEPITLELSIPNDSITFAFMHPFLELGEVEPYQWQTEKKGVQLNHLQRCLNIASNDNNLMAKTLFTVFPEYSIPGLDGIAAIQNCLENHEWKAGTIVIGGVDGLNKADYGTLCRIPGTFVSEFNRPEFVNPGQWVNCMVLWVVNEDDRGNRIIKRWVQPKLCPSGVEEQGHSQHMFEGKSVNLYECHFEDGRPFRFFCLLCYDWVAPVNSGLEGVLSQLNARWGGGDPRFVHISFVLQHNAKPNHASFLGAATSYFNEQSNPFVDRSNSIIAFVNTAGSPNPGKVNSYGFSSLIYSPNLNSNVKSSPPSYAIQTQRLRQSDSLQTCRDVLFRENGACIHLFQAFQPRYLLPAPTHNRRFPLGLVSIHGIDTDERDVRTPGRPVAAIIKWINDRLDLATCLISTSQPIQELLQQKHVDIIRQLRGCNFEKLNKIITWVDNERETGFENDDTFIQMVDQWFPKEETNLMILIHAFSLLACSGDVMMEGVSQGYIRRGNDIIDILVICGPTHRENLERAENIYPGYQGRRVLIVSRDKDDLPMTNLDKSILDVSDNLQCSFHDLKTSLEKVDVQAFTEKLVETIGA